MIAIYSIKRNFSKIKRMQGGDIREVEIYE